MTSQYTRRRWRSAALFAGMLLASTLAAVAQTVFTGATSTDWFDATNWSNGLPAPGNDAVVPGGASVAITAELNADFGVASFGTIDAQARVLVRGSFSNSGTLTTDQRINVYGTFENFGDLELGINGSLFTTPTGTTRTNGTILNEGWLGAKGLLINEGTIDVTAEGGLAIYETGEFRNPGVVNLAGFYNNRDGGRYSAPSGGTINIENAGRLVNYNDAEIRNAGIINVLDGGLFSQRAQLINVPGRIFVDGTLATTAQSVTRSNFLTINAGGTLNANAADTFQIVFSLVNDGAASVGSYAEVGGVIENGAQGTFTVTGNGTLDFIAGTNLTNAGTFNNAGVIRTVGTLTNTGTFTNNGSLLQNNGGSIVNAADFFNKALIENVDRIVNTDRFVNEGRLTNDSGGVIENEALLVNAVDAHIQNLFQIYNDSLLVNRGYFENGVSLFNEADFENFGFLANVGDIFNNPAGRIFNKTSGVIDNSGAGIFTNEGFLLNEGEINNFACGIFDNHGTIENPSWITNNGIFYQDGTLTGKAIMGEGPVVVDGGSSPLICQPFTQKLDQNGNTTVSGTRFAAPRFDSCDALTYLIDGEENRSFTCADLGTQQIQFTLVDRRGNEINCATTLTITDEFAPRIDSCPADILIEDVAASELPVAASWTVPTFTDNCDGDVAVVASNQPGDLFPEGSTVVSYVATDDAGNEFVCEFTVRVVKEAVCQPKDHDGLVAYYNLINGSSKHVTDRAGYAEPLHARILDQSAVRWAGDNCGLRNVANHGIVKTWGGATHVGNAIKMTNALTLEAWVRPNNTTQTGPARIVTYSENTSLRNFSLGQKNGKYIFRLKTTHTDGNGLPDRETPAGTVKPNQDQHVVFTRDANGQERFYVDGQLVYSGQVGGNLSNWGTHCHLAFFNEMSLDRPWKGALKKVAIYDRAWSQAEVLANRSRGACGCDDSPRGNTCEGARGQVTYERYDNIGGQDLPWLYKNAKFPKQPDVTRKLTKLQLPASQGDSYGSRTRGWIYPDATGDYRFAVSGDDHVRFLLSPVADNASGAYIVAYHNGWTNPGDLHKYTTQKSQSFHLQAGKAYYFELYQKEGAGGDHGAVYWKRPGATNFSLIGANFIGDVEKCSDQNGAGNGCQAPKGGLLREVWNGVNSSDIWALMADPRYPDNPDSRGLIEAYCGPSNVGDAYGTRVRGYIHPDVTGDYRFTVTGDNQTKLILSTDDTEANGQPIAEVIGHTGPHEFHKMASQKSGVIRLVAGRRYYTELIHQEGVGGDFFNVFWQTPTNSSRVIVPGANLSPYVDCADGEQPAVCNTDVLLVVGNATLNNGDAAVKHRLQQLGYTVTVKDAQWANAAMAAGKGLVLISSTVNSGDVGTKFRDVSTPVLTWESWLYDDMRMTAAQVNVDYGVQHAQKLVVTGGTDQLAAGRRGHQDVYAAAGDIRFGKVMGSEARVIAHAPADPWMASVFAYDPGAQMAGGLRAPGKRIGFYLDNDGAAHWTAYGKALFDAAVRYATDCTGSETARRETDVLDLTAAPELGAVELEWVSNTAYKTETYLVERSADDVTYYVIDEVTADGTGDAMAVVNYTDRSPAVGANYYRVTAVYTDGTDRQSQLRLVTFEERGAVAMFPNPATDRVTVALTDFGDDHDATVTLADALGRTISTRTVAAGTAQLDLDVAALPVGWYAVTVESGGARTTELLMVRRD